MPKNEPVDTYFFDSDKALETAKNQNRVKTAVELVSALQVCYYAGDIKLENTPSNCIHLPLEDIYTYFVKTKNRFPKALSFENSDYSQEEEDAIQLAIAKLLDAAKNERIQLSNIYAQQIHKNKPDFNEKVLRVFIPACRETTVMQYVSKNIAVEFKKLGCEVLYLIQDELGHCEPLHFLESQAQFNPHIIVRINHLDNEFLHEDVFNFCWFMDHMPILHNDAPMKIRKRDFIFSLYEYYDELLLKKISKKKISRQQLATNPQLFFKDPNITRENKVVFLGSDYNYEKNSNLDPGLREKLYLHIDNNELTDTLLRNYAKKYQLDYVTFKTWIIPSLVRRRVIIWMCSLKNINVEVYGTDIWLNNPEVVPYYKGLLPYGNEMSKMYNSTKYALAVNPEHRYQQRVIEMSACGTIPIMYVCPLTNEKFDHEDNILTFSTFKELESCIGKIPPKDPAQIAEDISYKIMVENIIDKVKKKLLKHQKKSLKKKNI